MNADKEYIRKFIGNEGMARAVKQAIEKEIRKVKGDVHTLAAAKIALDQIDEAFKSMERNLKNDNKPAPRHDLV